MNHTTSTLIFCALLFLLMSPASARETEEGGFSGMIFLGAAYTSSDLSLNDASEDENKPISSLSRPSRSENSVIPVIIGSLSYTFADSGTTIGIDGEDGGGAVFISQELAEWGAVSFAFNYNEEDVFSDPFVTGTARSVTDRETIEYLFAWEDIFQTGISVGYDIAVVDIDNDTAGKRDHRLKRDGNIHTFSLSGDLFEYGSQSMGAGVVFEIADLSGQSYSSDGFGLQLTHTWQARGWDISTELSFIKRDYDGTHPEFNKTRDEVEFSLSSAYTYYDPFGFENYFISVFGDFTKNDSNIGFYDGQTLAIGLGVGYSF